MTIKNPEIAAAVEAAKQDRALVKQEAVNTAMAGLELDWRRSKADAIVHVIATSPVGSDDQGNPRYMTPAQATVFALSCFQLNLSPFLNHAWLNPKTGRIALTVEGHREVARSRGYKIGPPLKEPIDRPFEHIPVSTDSRQKIAALKQSGFDKDYGCKCTIEVIGFKQPAIYTAWLSEWYMPTNPNWKSRTTHMLSIRAEGHCLEMITGVGISSDIDKDEKAEAEGLAQPPQITVTEVPYVPLREIDNNTPVVPQNMKTV